MNTKSKFRIRRMDTSLVTRSKITYYGLYETQWDALRACVSKAEQVSMGYESSPNYHMVLRNGASGDEVNSILVDYGDSYESCTTFTVLEVL